MAGEPKGKIRTLHLSLSALCLFVNPSSSLCIHVTVLSSITSSAVSLEAAAWTYSNVSCPGQRGQILYVGSLFQPPVAAHFLVLQ